MNQSWMLTQIRRKLGLLNVVTPYEDLDGEILSIIIDNTVPVFSIYCPVRERLHLNMQDLELVEKNDISEKYLLPDFKTRKLIYVFDIKYDTQMVAGLGYWGGGIPLTSGNILQQMALTNAGMNTMNLMLPKLTFNFEKPRAIEIFNGFTSTTLVFDVGFQHDDSLVTITDTQRDSFMKLAMLDVKSNLYPTLKHYSENQTAIGNISLKLDGWDNAESERDALIDKWDETYHFDQQPFYYF